MTGGSSVLGYLASKGYEIFPSGAQIGNPREDPRFNGGHTVFSYGSNNAQGIDAIQIEIGRTIRSDRAFAGNLAAAIVVFYRRYLLAQGGTKQSGTAR